MPTSGRNPIGKFLSSTWNAGQNAQRQIGDYNPGTFTPQNLPYSTLKAALLQTPFKEFDFQLIVNRLQKSVREYPEG